MTPSPSLHSGLVIRNIGCTAQPRPMPCDIEISGETEGCGHWSWAVRIYLKGRVKHHTVSLSFSDYDFWSHGMKQPAQIAHKALSFAFEHEDLPALPPSFDLARLRRLFPQIDAAMTGKN